MSERDWQLSHIYPNNSPVRRIVALTYLLERYDGGRSLIGILDMVRRASLSGGHRLLQNSLIVHSGGYWRDHFDFGVRSRTKIAALLGRSKAGEIAVNVILPFAFSRGELTDEPALSEGAMTLYRSYPSLAGNYLTQHMEEQLGLEESLGLTACHKQGLIHIFKHYCREGRCRECPLST